VAHGGDEGGGCGAASERRGGNRDVGGGISTGGDGVPFLKGVGGTRNRRGGGRATWLMRGGSGAQAGGVPADRRAAPGRQRPETDGRARCQPNRGGGERLTGGPRQQCRAAVPLTSGARRATGEGERSEALTGGTGLSAGVDGGEAAACAGHAWAGPGRKKGGPSPDE
jgi:hypothetical protein